MPFHENIEFTSVGLAMATSFAFWWVAGYVLGGDRYAPAILGMVVTGVRGAIAGADAASQLPDNLGVVTVTSGGMLGYKAGYSRGSDTGAGVYETAWSAGLSAIVTFCFWMLAGYFVIKGSAWKYATTAATIAAIGAVVTKY